MGFYDLPPLTALPAFEAAARRLSFKAAARELSVTPSAISQQIRRLEDELGMELFERRTRAVDLTEAGEVLANVVSSCFDDLSAAFRRLRQDQQQSLCVSMMPFLAHELVIPRLSEFHEACPEIELVIRTGMRLTQLESEEVDAAVRLSGPPPPEIDATLLSECSGAAVAAPEVAARIRRSRKTTVRFIGVRGRDERGLEAARRLNLRVDRRRMLRFESYFEALRAAEQGHGVCFAVLPLSATWLASGRLAPVSAETVPLDEQLYFVCRKAEVGRPGMRELRDWLLRTCADLEGVGRKR